MLVKGGYIHSLSALVEEIAAEEKAAAFRSLIPSIDYQACVVIVRAWLRRVWKTRKCGDGS